MIISIWAILLGFALILLVAGRYTDAPPLQIGGYTIIFILGALLMLGFVTYKTGEVTTYQYETEEQAPCNCSMTMSNTTITYSNYTTTYPNLLEAYRMIGFIMCVLSVLGFMSVFFNLNPRKKKPGAYDLKDDD